MIALIWVKHVQLGNTLNAFYLACIADPIEEFV